MLASVIGGKNTQVTGGKVDESLLMACVSNVWLRIGGKKALLTWELLGENRTPSAKLEL